MHRRAGADRAHRAGRRRRRRPRGRHGDRSAGSASASRLTWMVGGAVSSRARRAVAVLERAAGCSAPAAALTLRDGAIWPATIVCWSSLRVGGEPIACTRTYRHARTQRLDPITGQGDAHAGLRVRRAPGGRRRRRRAGAGARRRADVRTGRRPRRQPVALEGQLQGGSIQGLGLALTEELLLDGRPRPDRGVRRLPDPDDRRRRRRPVDRPGARRPGHALRAARRGGDAVDLLDPRDARRAAGRDRPALTRAPVRPEDLVVHDEEDRDDRAVPWRAGPRLHGGDAGQPLPEPAAGVRRPAGRQARHAADGAVADRPVPGVAWSPAAGRRAASAPATSGSSTCGRRR